MVYLGEEVMDVRGCVNGMVVDENDKTVKVINSEFETFTIRKVEVKKSDHLKNDVKKELREIFGVKRGDNR